MALERISLMEAYIIETLKSSGVTSSELIHVNDSAVEKWKKEHETFDFTLLTSLAENDAAFASIIEVGYQIKFLTFNGLVNILRLKFSKVPEQDFEKREQSIEKLQMTEEQLAGLRGMLSPNWTIVPAEETNTVSIKQTGSI